MKNLLLVLVLWNKNEARTKNDYKKRNCDQAFRLDEKAYISWVK